MPIPIANYHCLVGEGPLYDDRRNCLFWTDIDSGRLFRYDLATHQHHHIYSGPKIGGYTLQQNGDLLLFRQADIALFDPDSVTTHAAGHITTPHTHTPVRVLRQFSDDGSSRFNDVIATPAGQVLAGTIGKTPTSGGLFLIDHDLNIRLLHRGTGCANGLAFSPDLSTCYWTCTTRRCIFAYDFSPSTSALSNERVFLAAEPDTGYPDGLTIDADGNLYSARWAGGAVHVYSPQAKPLSVLRFPVKTISSVTFGGPTLTDLYATSAQGNYDLTAHASPDHTKPDGTLYMIKDLAKGLPEYRSAIAS
jgi:D-xylonolactonase